MRAIRFLIRLACGMLAAVLVLGLFIGIMPLAIVAPEHGEALVRFQAAGFCAALLALFLMIVIASISSFFEKP